MNNLFKTNNPMVGYNNNNMYAPHNMMDVMRQMYGQPRNQIQWVLGIENAKSYPMQPNSTVLLMDSEQPRFYIKTADQNNMCSIKTYDFQEVQETPAAAPTIDVNTFITREELSKLLESANFATKNDLEQLIANLSNKNIEKPKTLI